MPKDMTCARMRKYIELRDKLWHKQQLSLLKVSTEIHLHALLIQTTDFPNKWLIQKQWVKP